MKLKKKGEQSRAIDHNDYIPERFIARIDAHLLGNILEVRHFPLILIIEGDPGMGKTYQLRHYLKSVNIIPYSVSAADLESNKAGDPAKLLQQKYAEASADINEMKPAVLLIDDIDTTLGERDNYTGTINHFGILAFLMHIADNPTFIEDIGKVRRVPIFFTGNDIEKLYKPLIREGRAARYYWEPEREEKIRIVSKIFEFPDDSLASILVDAFPDEKISFFSNLISREQLNILSQIAKSVDYKKLLESKYFEVVNQDFSRRQSEIRWEKVISELIKDGR